MAQGPRLNGYRVLLVAAAAARLDAMGSRPRGMLSIQLAAIAAGRPPEGLLSASAAGEVAACEVIADRQVVLVYAVVSARDLLASLYGSELDRRLRRLEIRRAVHA